MTKLDEQWLREKYVQEELSCTEIAEQSSFSRSTVHRGLKRHDIQRRDQGFDRFEGAKYRDEDWLRQKHCVEGLSYSEIGELCGVSKQCIYQNAKKLGIKSPNSNEGSKKKRYRDEEWFRSEYLKKDRTLSDIADECDVARQTVMSWREKHGIPVQYPTGEHHPSTKPNEECVTRSRGQDWHRQRNLALERAEYACENPDCDEDAESLGQNPDVHHIVPYRFHDQYDGINELDNLVVLCRSCHAKAEPAEITKIGTLNEVNGEDESVLDMSVDNRYTE